MPWLIPPFLPARPRSGRSPSADPLPLYDIETFYVCADSLAARGLNEKIPFVLDVTILTSSALREQLSHYDTVLTF